MANVTLVKRSQAKMAGRPHQVGAPAPGEYALQVDEDGSVTVFGRNAAKETVDISGVATLTATSDDPSILSVDAPNGMSCAYHAQGVGKTDVVLTAAANDGSFSFTISDPCDVDKNALRGATINHGTPTIR